MARSFTIEPATDTLKANPKEPAQAVFSVTNATSNPVRGLAAAKALGDTKREWLSILGETERDFERGGQERFTVKFDTSSAPAGKYPFRLDVASALNPQEDFTVGPTVTLEVPAMLIEQKTPFPKWIIPVIAGVVLLIGGVLAWLLFGRNGSTQDQPVASYRLPDVEDTGEDRARKRLEEECTQSERPCVVVEVNRVFDDKVAEGRTIRTEPGAGTEVSLGSKVVLFTSLGPTPPLGGFAVTNGSVGSFGDWAASTNAQPLVGDFNGDSGTDVALTGPSGWTSLPVAFSNGDGTFKVTNESVADFAFWAASANAKPLVGDFNDDGRADVALTGPSGWASLPVAFSNGDGTFKVTNQSIADFAVWAASANAKPLVGDFNGDNRTDVALTGTSGWSTLPLASSLSPGG